MLVRDWLQTATKTLEDAGIAIARLDCLVLLEDETGKDRAWLLSHSEYKLQGSELENLSTKVTQRAQHIPLAYLRGKAEFYGREFMINHQVLVPRPESEAIIDCVKELHLPHGSCILDVGTGSGCLAITAALELSDALVQACDIDQYCLDITEQNAEKLGADVHCYVSNLLEDASHCDVLLCNLPYVPDSYNINQAATHEPKLALFAGDDGLDLYRKLFAQISANSWKPSYIITESLPESHDDLATIAEAAGYSCEKTDDFVQLFTRA